MGCPAGLAHDRLWRGLDTPNAPARPDFRARRVTAHLANWRGGGADVKTMQAMRADRVSLPGLTYPRVAAGLYVN